MVFLELWWEAWGSSRVTTWTSGNLLCCLRDMKSPFKLQGVLRDSSRVAAGEWASS